jgi:hypothetical protein
MRDGVALSVLRLGQASRLLWLHNQHTLLSSRLRQRVHDPNVGTDETTAEELMQKD